MTVKRGPREDEDKQRMGRMHREGDRAELTASRGATATTKKNHLLSSLITDNGNGVTIRSGWASNNNGELTKRTDVREKMEENKL